MTAPGYDELDTVVLLHDIPEAGLRVGDLGTLVHMNAPDSFEVEFVLASGRTQARLTLEDKDVRPVRDDDLLGVRSATPAEVMPNELRAHLRRQDSPSAVE